MGSVPTRKQLIQRSICAGAVAAGVLLGVVAPAGAAGNFTMEYEGPYTTGNGQFMSRANASGRRTVLLKQGESRRIPVWLAAPATYELVARFSNDNYGPLEWLAVTANGQPTGGAWLQDTGDWGFGWNIFRWTTSLGSVRLPAGNSSIVSTVAAGQGDCCGVELDVMSFRRIG